MTSYEPILSWPEFESGRDIELSIPADVAWVRIARLVGSGLAAHCDFDIDSLDDLSIAVSEVCSTLIELGDGAPIQLRVGVYGGMYGGLGVWLDAVTPTEHSGAIDEQRYALTERMLEVICDQHELDVAGGVARFRLIRLATSGVAEVDGDPR